MTVETASARRAPRVCVHHWIVEPADGRTSEGRCKHCGAIRSFSNSLETALEESMKTAGVEEPAASHRWR